MGLSRCRFAPRCSPVSRENLPVGEPLPEMAGAYPSPAVTSAAAMPLDGQTERLSDAWQMPSFPPKVICNLLLTDLPRRCRTDYGQAREPDVRPMWLRTGQSLTPAARGLGPSGDIAAEPAVDRPLSPGEGTTVA